LRPPLKWAGGKRSLIEEILSLFPDDYKERRYHEPFMGGGAIFFHIEPPRGTINDVNPRLINFYETLRDHPAELLDEASQYRYNETEYYERRKRFNNANIDPVEDAALFLYLNRTAYNGLYRVNSRGEFNVPFGKYKNPRIVNRNRLMDASSILKNMAIHCKDFDYILKEVRDGDICYLDPPYHPSSDTANFTEYAAGRFTLKDQERLKVICDRIHEKGVIFIQSNSDTEAVHALYENSMYQIKRLKTRRNISSKSSSRSSGADLLITNRFLSS
jgi:DNA adenine methylase